MFILKIFIFLLSFLLASCSNFEGLRREKFDPDYATKSPTTFLPSLPQGGRFLKIPLSKDHPLMLLKRGFGYSVYQLHNGRIGEVANEAVRVRGKGEDFKDFYNTMRPKPLANLGANRAENPSQVNVSPSVVGSNKGGETLVVYPIFDAPFEAVEPELPEW
jgi:hypothetical protein